MIDAMHEKIINMVPKKECEDKEIQTKLVLFNQDPTLSDGEEEAPENKES